jgi:hypothetical protein
MIPTAEPLAGPRALGLPDGIRGCLFDLDGVLTRTAEVHAAAGRETFDGFLREWSRPAGEQFVPFGPQGLRGARGRQAEGGRDAVLPGLPGPSPARGLDPLGARCQGLGPASLSCRIFAASPPRTDSAAAAAARRGTPLAHDASRTSEPRRD